MKTLKVALVAAIVVCTMVSLAYADGVKAKSNFNKVMNISFEQAVQNPGLVGAMYQQIDKDYILQNPAPTYIAQVAYQGSTYRITGTFDQWLRFFKCEQIAPLNTRKKIDLN